MTLGREIAGSIREGILLTLLSLIVIVVAAPPAAWLLLRAQTATGRVLALAGLGVAVLPLTLVLAQKRPAQHKFWRRGSLILGVMVALLVVAVLWRTPSGDPGPNSAVHHRFTRPARFQRYALANVIPEAEQINLGFLVMPLLDPLLTPQQARRVAPHALEIYREMEQDPDFRELGSAMGWAYAGLLGRPGDAGHYYLYVPPNGKESARPALVFLHGSAGNFKAYLWLWSRLAREQGFVVIAPSFGFGNWRGAGGVEAVLRALDDAATVVPIDEEQVYLAGLSNGGVGVSLLGAAAAQRFRGLIFLSPVMATEVTHERSFLQEWQGRPMLIVSGDADRRIPLAYVQEQVSLFEQAGVDVTEVIYPAEDHFLFFSRRDAVLDAIGRWLEDNAPRSE